MKISATAKEQFFMIMKISGVQIFLSVLLVGTTCAHSNFAQGLDKRISLNVTEQPLAEILHAIEILAPVKFAYSPDQINTQETISLSAEDETVGAILKRLLTPRKILFKLHPTTGTITLKRVTNADEHDDERVNIKSLEIPIQQITGTVLNARDQQPMPGVNIIVKGTTQGTTTDANGIFSIQADAGQVLAFSFIGFKTIEVAISNQTVLDVSLTEDAQNLNEVVINAGYYSTTKASQTGSIVKIEAKDIQKQPVSNPIAALIGRVPGLEITQQTGVPGGNYKVRIRGTNSLSNGNDPLYIIDGVPFMSTSTSFALTSGSILGNPSSSAGQGASPLNSINPADIESIEVLKDADATAIYGSRGANGVILITTKKGQTGSTKVDINMYQGAAKVPRSVNLLNRRQYLDLRREAFNNSNQIPTIANAPDLLLWDTTRNTNWQQELIGGTAQITDLQASISGGDQHTNFSFGTGYHHETTVFPGSNSDQRISSRLSISNKAFNDKLKTTISLNYALNTTDLLNRDLTDRALTLPPNAPALYTETGIISWLNWNANFENPLAPLHRRYENVTNNLIANATFSYSILKNLQLKTNLGFTHNTSNATNLVPISSLDPQTATTAQNSTSFSSSDFQNVIAEPQLSWNTKQNWGEWNVLAGTSFLSQTSQGIAQSATGFASESLMKNIAAATNRTVATNYYSEYRYQAFFGRINYAFNQKYFVNFTARRDGSSRFGPGKQFANFGAVGIAWVFTQQEQIKRTLPFLSFGKIRGSYGTTGNDQLGDYQYLDAYTITGTGFYQTANGLTPARLSNPDFAWETNRKLEAALELGFAHDRVQLTINYYRNRSSNQLVGYPLPGTTGFNVIQGNFPATVQNKGIEMNLLVSALERTAFRWTTSINMTIPRNELREFPELESFPAYAETYVVGEPLGIKKLYLFTGLDPTSGRYIMSDVNNDGKFTFEDKQSLKFVGQKSFGGLNNSLTYKQFQLDILFQFVQQQGYDRLQGVPGALARNQHSSVLNYWTTAQDPTNIPRPETQSYLQASLVGSSDLAITNASFVRLKNLSLAYTFPNQWINRMHLTQLRCYLQGQNLLTFTKYDKGLDPETMYAEGLPPLRTITAGLQLTF
jgi:TonB-dependent starch-binding outer membrane protein SusC